MALSLRVCSDICFEPLLIFFRVRLGLGQWCGLSAIAASEAFWSFRAEKGNRDCGLVPSSGLGEAAESWS